MPYSKDGLIVIRMFVRKRVAYRFGRCLMPSTPIDLRLGDCLSISGLVLHDVHNHVDRERDRDRTGFRCNQVYLYLQPLFAFSNAHTEYSTSRHRDLLSRVSSF